MLSQASASEAKYLTRTILEELRIGVGEGVVRDAIAQAFNIDKSVVERAMMLTNDLGLIAVVAKEKGEKNGMHPGMIDRLRLTGDRIRAMAEGLEQVAGLPDPIHEVLSTTTRPNGLMIKKVRVPLGVIGIIYESRPNVTADAFGLCFKSGNAVILKGGSDAIHSNIAITKVIRDALEGENLDANAIQLIEDTNRETTQKFMRFE